MPELRKDPIVGRWVIISTDRAKRPTDFTREGLKMKGGFCPFCPGNESKTPPEIQAYRPGNGGAPAAKNSPGWSVRVVPNKFPALGIEGTLDRQADGMFDRMNGVGAHEVIIETPDHNASLASLPAKKIEDILWAYRDRILDLKKDRRFKYILIFKNHGDPAGASLEHAHSQLIALPIVPIYVTEEITGAKQYFLYKERCVFCDVVRQESDAGVRVVAENADFLTIAPYAPRFPFETWILPKRHESAFENSSTQMFESLAVALKTLLMKADRVLDNPPYNLVVHTSPVQESTNDHYHWHVEFMPKLTKTAGFEWGTGFYINPTPPEEAARFLREASVEEPQAVSVRYSQVGPGASPGQRAELARVGRKSEAVGCGPSCIANVLGNQINREDFLTPTKFSSKQELLCWLIGSLLAITLFIRSHTFYVTTATYGYGIALFSVGTFLLWLKFRKRQSPEPRWLRLTSNVVLVILIMVFLLYLFGVATWYE